MKLSYFSYFFTYETQIPDGIGFSLYGGWHLLWLAMIAGAAVCYVNRYRKAAPARRRRMDAILSGSLIAWIAARMIYVAVIGENLLYELPLHLCSIAGILCAVHHVTGKEWIGQTLYAICLPGTVLALLFPNWNAYPVIHFITLEAFLFHGGIVLYVAGQLAGHEIVPSMAKLWQALLFLTAVVLPVYVFDKAFHVNYMFVNVPSPGSPLVWLEAKMGNPGYLLGYAGLVLLCMFLMEAGYKLHAKRCAAVRSY